MKNKVKVLETKLYNDENIEMYSRVKQDLVEIVNEIAKVFKITLVLLNPSQLSIITLYGNKRYFPGSKNPQKRIPKGI